MAKNIPSKKPVIKSGAAGSAKNAKSKPAKAVVARKPEVKPAAPAKKAAPAKTVKPVAKKPAAPVKATPKKAAPAKAALPKKAPVKVAPAPKAAPKVEPVRKAAPAAKAALKTKPVKKGVSAAKPAPKKPVARKAPLSAKAVTGKIPSVVETQARKLAIQKIQAKRNLAHPPVQRPAANAAAALELLQPTGMYNGIVVTHEIKPFPAKTPYTKPELDELRDALLAKRVELLGELASLQGVSMEALVSAKEHSGYSIHIAEHASDLQTAEANMGVRTIEEGRLKELESALDRIENNPRHYGLCMACGNKIGIQRLKARPQAHLCMNCRTRYETIRSRRGY